MGMAQNPALKEAIVGALDWWRDAGVDCAFLDEPVSWLAAPEPPQQLLAEEREPVRKPAVAPAPEPQAPSLDLSSLPNSLDAFAQWWMNEPTLADGALGRRVAPRGPAGAELMVIVPEPEREDSDTLLSGPEGRLLKAMLAAFGLDPEQVYFASALPRHLPGADWGGIASSGMGQVLQRHLTLVAPKRLVVFGTTVLPLIGHVPPQAPADLRKFNHEDLNVPMLACRSLAALLQQPRWKAPIWQAWLEMTA